MSTSNPILNPILNPIPISDRSENEKFRKRSETILQKLKGLNMVCNAQVYLLIERNNKFYTWKSTDRPSWPPSETTLHDIVPMKDPVTKRVKYKLKWALGRTDTPESGMTPEDMTPERQTMGAGDDGVEVRQEPADVKLIEKARHVKDVPSGYTVLMPPSLIRSPVDS